MRTAIQAQRDDCVRNKKEDGARWRSLETDLRDAFGCVERDARILCVASVRPRHWRFGDWIAVTRLVDSQHNPVNCVWHLNKNKPSILEIWE